jgi:hypothetical protein
MGRFCVPGGQIDAGARASPLKVNLAMGDDRELLLLAAGECNKTQSCIVCGRHAGARAQPQSS